MRLFCLLIRSWGGGTQGQRWTKWKHTIALILIFLFLRPFSKFCELDVFSLICFIWWLLEFYFAVRHICMNCYLYQVSTLLYSLHAFFCIKNLFFFLFKNILNKIRPLCNYSEILFVLSWWNKNFKRTYMHMFADADLAQVQYFCALDSSELWHELTFGHIS